MAIVTNTNAYSISRIPDLVADTLAELQMDIALYVGKEVLTLDDGTIWFVASGSEDAPTTPHLVDIKYNNGGLLTATTVDENSHKALDQLVHNLAENAFVEFVRVGGKITSVITWTDNSKTTKIREQIFIRSGSLVTQIITRQYDDAGVLVPGETKTDTINRSVTIVDNMDVAMS